MSSECLGEGCISRSLVHGQGHWCTVKVTGTKTGCTSVTKCTHLHGSSGIEAWSWRPTGFLQCFDTVGLVIWPVKIVSKMTYNVLSGTLSLYTTTITTCVLSTFNWKASLFEFFADSEVELYCASTWIHWPAQSADGAIVQQDINGADVSPWLQVSY